MVTYLFLVYAFWGKLR